MAFSRLSCGITLDQIDAYFSVGKPVPKSDTVPGLSFRGRPLDPVTKKPLEVKEEYVIKSRFKRPQYDNMAAGGPGSLAPTTYYGDESSLLESSLAAGDMQQLEVDTLPELACLNITTTDRNKDPAFLEVYRHYNFKHKYDESLPVFQYKQEILDMIENNEVTIIQGETGSGKTTQVPQFILDEHQANMKYCNIVVTQPRKIAATSIARRVCHERNWQVGQLVGYQVGLDKVTSEDTRITYMTVGVLLRQLVKQKDLKNYTHIILDEVHERDQETDFALLVVRRLLRLNSKTVKVILMSATFDTDEFARYFLRPVMDKPEMAPVVSVQGRSYEVTEHFLEELGSLGTLPTVDSTDPDISDEAFQLAVKLIKYFDQLEAKERMKQEASGSMGSPVMRGAVLVFLPGIFYIRELEQLLEYSRVESKFTIVPLHSSITLEEQSQVFSPPKSGMRKIILSTNIAESSITVPDIKYVIDFCLTKSLLCDLDTNYQSLRLQWASKSNGIQRKGRAGRVSNGHVYRLVSKYFWEKEMSEYGMPEMQRCPLEHVILQVKLLDLGEPKAILSMAMSPPRLENIERTILLLKEVGALSTIGNACRQRHDGDLTFVGKVLAALPLDMRLGKLLLLGYVFGCLEDCIVIAAALSKGSFLAIPYREVMDAYRHRLRWASGSFSDCIAYLKAYRAWEHAVNTQMFRRKRDEHIWCKKNFIQARRIHEVHMLVRELTDRLRSFNIRSADQAYWQNDTYEDCELILKVAMAGAFYPNYFYNSDTDEKPALKEMSELDPHRTIMMTGLPAGKGPLYSDSLQFALKECGKPKSLYFDGSKAFLEFSDEPDDKLYTGKVLPSVYVACKMRDWRRKIQIVQSHAETSETWKYLKRPFLYDAINTSDFKREIPKPGGPVWISITVTYVISLNHFWGCKADEPYFSKQQKLFKQIQESSRHAEAYNSPILADTLVLAPYSDGTGTWYYRGLVQRREGTKVKVFFVDYGNSSSNIDTSKLKKVPPQVADIPFQAIEFELKCVRPLESVSLLQGKKIMDDLLMTCENRCNAKVYSVVSDRTRVDLFTLDDTYVNDHLVNEGYAANCAESALSERNHGEWEFVESNRIKSEEEYQAMSTSDWRPVPTKGRGALIPHPQRRNPVQLYGPKNPFESSFNSMINIGQLRNVRVERDSVNSIVINQDPTDEHRNLMVAACVGVNESGSTMLARNTTLLPKIHGLPHITPMLFAPVLELRSDRHRMRLTGAICGLGAMKTRVGTLSILPEHDMEMTFDTVITIDDIIAINSLRMKINMTVGSSEEIASWSQSAIHKIQKSARSKLLKLLHKQRPSVAPENFCKPFKWDQLEDRFVLPHDVDHRSADRKDLYRLHDAILLNKQTTLENF